MTINSFEAAKKICHLSSWTVTNLKLQKFLYLAHMVNLGRTGEPLISALDEKERHGGCFEAWDYGPVLPYLYHHLKIFGSSPVKNRFYRIDIIGDTPEGNLLEETWEALGNKDGWELVSIVHRPKGAWAKNYSPGINKIIPNEDILQEYRQFYVS